MLKTVDIVQFDAHSKPVAVEALPASFRAAYTKSLERTRAIYKDMKPGDFPGSGRKVKP